MIIFDHRFFSPFLLSVRGSQKDCHLALPYYRMSGLSITDVISRNRPSPSSLHSYGSGFLFYLRHYLIEETEHSLSQVHRISAVTRLLMYFYSPGPV